MTIVKDSPLARYEAGSNIDRSLRLQARTPASFGGAKELVNRIQLMPTDAKVSLGTGPTVSGSALSLLLAVSGRREALTDLEGPGLRTLTAY